MDPVIKDTEERLEWLSSDNEMLELYEMRENSRIERNSLIRGAKEEGREEGREEGQHHKALEIALKLLQSGMDVERVAEITELPVAEVKKLL